MEQNATELLTKEATQILLNTLRKRFIENFHRHKGLEWQDTEKKLLSNPLALKAIFQMEQTGGEPDVALLDDAGAGYYYLDCSA